MVNRSIDRVPGIKDGQYLYLDAVLEQLHYWGVNTDNHRELVAEHVIKELLKIIERQNSLLVRTNG